MLSCFNTIPERDGQMDKHNSYINVTQIKHWVQNSGRVADCAVLSAIDEDNSCVPRLLTDYILKGQLLMFSMCC